MTTTAHGTPSDVQRDAPTISKLAESMELDRSEGPLRPAMVATVREVRERLRRIEAVTDVALSKLTTEDLLDELLARLQELLDVDTAATLLLDDSGQFLSPVAARGLEEEVRHGVRIPFGRGFAGRVAAEARPIAIAEVTPSNVINPILLRKKVRSLLGVPLLVGDTVLGVLHVGTLRPRAFSDEDTAVLQLAADRAAGAISARRSYIDRAAAASLQRSLAPRRLPDIPGYQLAARYVPGSQYGVSGDWYDLFTLPDDTIGIVIGDVMGHGLRAATIMGRIKSALRAYALDHDDPATVVHHLDRKLQHFEPGQMATLIYAILDAATGAITFSSAGHLPLTLVSAAGHARLLEKTDGLPLGVDLAAPRSTVTLAIEPGSLLCLLTDGLIDHHNSDIYTGLATVRTVLAHSVTADSPYGLAESACAALMTTLVGDRRVDDDVTILAIARDAYGGSLTTQPGTSMSGTPGDLRPQAP
jgi:phosphoserine phosphatase RsbU/P